MRAKVNDESRFPIITSCAGREFVKFEYREVPAGLEDEAKANPFLEIETEEPAAAELPVSLSLPPKGEVDATESALALATESDVDLSLVEGTGVEGRIIKPDVERFLAEIMVEESDEELPEEVEGLEE